MTHIIINDATPAYDGTVLKSRHVLALKGTYYRFGVGGIPRGQSGRKVYQGPLVPGPWAFAYGLGSMITANPEHSTGAQIRRNTAEGIEHTVTEGDRVTFDGVTYEVRVVRRQWIELVQVETPEVWTAQDAKDADALDAAREEGAAEFHAVVAEQDARRAHRTVEELHTAHRSADPDCSCNDCLADHQAQLAAGYGDPDPTAEDYPGQRITGPDFDTRDREGRDCCSCEVGIVTEGCSCECHGDGGETGPRRDDGITTPGGTFHVYRHGRSWGIYRQPGVDGTGQSVVQSGFRTKAAALAAVKRARTAK